MDNIWVELENYYGRLDFLIKLICEEELKPNEIDVSALWQKLKAILDQILKEKKNLDTAIFILFAISKILELKISHILNCPKDEEEIIPFNFAFIFELQKIRKILPQLEKMMEGGIKNYPRGASALEKLMSGEPQKLENLNIQNIYKLYKNKITQIKLPKIEIKKSDYNWQEVVDEFMAMLNSHRKINFHFLVEHIKNTYKILLFFIVILELIKQNVVEVYQEELYKDFIITLKEVRYDNTQKNF